MPPCTGSCWRRGEVANEVDVRVRNSNIPLFAVRVVDWERFKHDKILQEAHTSKHSVFYGPQGSIHVYL